MEFITLKNRVFDQVFSEDVWDTKNGCSWDSSDGFVLTFCNHRIKVLYVPNGSSNAQGVHIFKATTTELIDAINEALEDGFKYVYVHSIAGKD